MHTLDTSYIWKVSGAFSTAAEGRDEERHMMALPIEMFQMTEEVSAATRTSRFMRPQRNEATDGPLPRCPDEPAGLACFKIDPNLPHPPGGCGGVLTAPVIKNSDFEGECYL